MLRNSVAKRKRGRNANMPLVRIEILKGKDASYQKTLLQAVHDALVTAIGIPD